MPNGSYANADHTVRTDAGTCLARPAYASACWATDPR